MAKRKCSILLNEYKENLQFFHRVGYHARVSPTEIFGMHGRFKAIKRLRQWFAPKHNSILGIDISSSAIKILELSREGDSFRVEHYGYEALPSHAINGYAFEDIDAVSTTIKNLLARLHISCTEVVLAVPDAITISKVVQIYDGLTDEEMHELIVIEADKYIPYPLTEINLDFEVLGSCKRNPALLDVLVVASRTENINNRVDAVSRAGLNVRAVDVTCYAVVRSIQRLATDVYEQGRDKTIAIIEIEPYIIRIFIMYGLNLIYSREEPRSVSEFIEPLKENIVSQVKRALHFFYSSSQEEVIDHIFLAGEFSKIPGITALLQKQLGVVTAIANPFTYMMPGTMINWSSLNIDAPTLLVACGLALKELGITYDSN